MDDNDQTLTILNDLSQSHDPVAAILARALAARLTGNGELEESPFYKGARVRRFFLWGRSSGALLEVKIEVPREESAAPKETP